MKEIVYKLPSDFLHRVKKIYPNHYHNVINTFVDTKETTFRINYLKTDLTNLRKELVNKKIRFKELPYPLGAFILKSSLREFQNTDIYTNGLGYVQNVSSMIPPLVLSPQNGDEILDLCAAPGTKTTQIVSLAPQANVTAIEKNRIRYYKLLANLKTQGADKVKVLLIDGIWVRKKFPEYFDKILLDAPCSAEGRFNLNNPRSYKYWSERKVKEMVRTQKKLLYAAFFALKEEGVMVYSTCTFSPEENEEIISWFLDKFEGKVELQPIDIPLNNVYQGLGCWKDKQFASHLRFTRRIVPNEYMEGFFIAKLKKTNF